jgi:hypothetical protein
MNKFLASKFATIFLLMIAVTVFLSACGSPAETAKSTSVSENSIAPTQTTAADTGNISSATAAATSVVGVPAVGSVSFAKDVMPIFELSCVKCHGVEKINRGLDLTTYDKAMAGSVKGPVILAGDAENSTLIKLISQGKMPKQGKKLTPEQLAIIKEWITAGAQNN